MLEKDTNMCAIHADRDKDISEIKHTINTFVRPKLSKLSGQWKVLLVGIGLFATGMGILATFLGMFAQGMAESQIRIAESQKSIQADVSQMNTVFTANMGVTAQQYISLQEELIRIDETVDDHEVRLRTLEIRNLR